MSHEEFEKTVMTALLAGDQPDLQILREQYSCAIVKERKFDPTGVFVYFSLPDDIPRTGVRTFHLGDVRVTCANAGTPIDVILFVKDGRLAFLECLVFDEKYPRNPEITLIDYYGSAERDAQYLRTIWPA